jgi:hypothetical protein
MPRRESARDWVTACNCHVRNDNPKKAPGLLAKNLLK